MSNQIEFDTPENVRIRYQQSGLGTRFVAWLTDEILLMIIYFVLFIVLLALGMLESGVFRLLAEAFGGEDRHGQGIEYQLYILGFFVLLLGLGNFLYFVCFELLMRGQTPGKRSARIRVVKVDGFTLDFVSITLRNIFRIIDQLPVLWIVPVLSARSQRLGDIVAGTIIVLEPETPLDAMREALSTQDASQNLFHFEGKAGRVAPQQFYTIEEIVKRVKASGVGTCEEPLRIVTEALAAKLAMEVPPAGLRLQFLEEFLVMEYHRQSQWMG